MYQLSVIIPARREMFLRNTCEDVLAHTSDATEVIAVLDGAWADPPLNGHPRLRVTHSQTVIGQRAATNLGARTSEAKYIAKLDAHCSVADGFDVALISAGDELGHDVTQIPRMYNLHVFDWKCGLCGHRVYQGPRPLTCDGCNETADFSRVMVWRPRLSRLTDFARFDHDLHFQYWRECGKRHESKGDFADVMSSVGACFFMQRDRFWELGGMDEAHGSWGQYGCEVACKSWLSGGRQVVNKTTWFSHLFRTNDGFSFPYPISGAQQEQARKHSRKLWLENTWDGQRHPLSWLIDKFKPLPDWHDPIGAQRLAEVCKSGEAFTRRMHIKPTKPHKGVVYYSDCRGDEAILSAVRRQLQRAAADLPLVSVTLRPLAFGHNIVLPLERGYLTMFKQILAGLEELDTEVVFFAEHDILYHPSHFWASPPTRDAFWYNQNTWKVSANDGRALHYICCQTSGLCADRLLLIQHYRKRIAAVEANAAKQLAETGSVRNQGYDRNLGFEPGTNSSSRALDPHGFETWMSPVPNIDIRHGYNLTPSRWEKSAFRDKKSCLGWTEASEVPGWGVTKGRFAEFLAEV